VQNDVLKIAKQYYEGWETSNSALLKLSPNLKFRSPDDKFSSAKDFLDKCWQYSGAKFQDKIFLSGENNVCIKYGFPLPDGTTKTIIEWLTFEAGSISEIEVFYEKD